jgi:hypothetical protein
MPDTRESFQHMKIGPFLLGTLRGILPDLVINVAGTLLVYELLQPRFPAASLIPLLGASFVPVLANIISILRHRRLDIFGVLVFIGLAVSIIGVLLGGGPHLLLIRESFVTGAIGVALLISLVFPRPLGYYFAERLLVANDPARKANFDTLSRSSHFRQSLQQGTLFWGLLLLGELALRIALVLTLPIVLVLTIAPIVFNAIIFAGIIVSILWTRTLLQHIERQTPPKTIELDDK